MPPHLDTPQYPPSLAPRVALLAHAGNGNLGDEATLAALILNIRRRLPHADIVAFTSVPEDTQRRHGVRAVPLHFSIRRSRAQIEAIQQQGNLSEPSSGARLRQTLKSIAGARSIARRLRSAMKFLKAIAQAMAFVPYAIAHLRNVDLLIVAGGGQLSDYFGGPWGYPYAMFRWCVAAKAMGAKVAFVSVGAGPLLAPLSRSLVRIATSTADYRSFRDVSSAQLVAEIGTKNRNLVYPDLVHSLSFPTRTHGILDRGSLVVGMNVLPYFDRYYWAEHDEGTYRGYVSVLSRFAVWLIERGHRVCLFPTQLRADPRVVEDIRRDILATDIPATAGGIVDCPVDDYDSLVSRIAEMDVVVASRFHGIVFALEMEKPVIGISYDPKTNDLMRNIGLGSYVLDIAGLRFEALVHKFELLEKNMDEVEPMIVAAKAAYATQLAEQYDRVLSLAVRAVPEWRESSHGLPPVERGGNGPST